jgi:hypothetical protein
MQLVDTLALADFHIPHIRNDPALLYRYQFGERNIDLAVWHGAAALPRHVFGKGVIPVAEFADSPRAFWARRGLVELAALPSDAPSLGTRGRVRLWLSPATIWRAAPGCYARIEIILRLDPADTPSSGPADHPSDAPGLGPRMAARVRDADGDEEELPLLGATAASVTAATLAAGKLYRQAFLLRAPDRQGQFVVTIVHGLPGGSLDIGSLDVAPVDQLDAEQVAGLVGGDATPLVDQAQRLAQIAEQLQPRRRRRDIADDLFRLQHDGARRKWTLPGTFDRLRPDFSEPPRLPPPLEARAQAIGARAARAVVQGLGPLVGSQPRPAPVDQAQAHAGAVGEDLVAEAALAAGRLLDDLRRRRITGVLTGDGPDARAARAAVGALRGRANAMIAPRARYKALVGLSLLEPRDMHLQRALLRARPSGFDLEYR